MNLAPLLAMLIIAGPPFRPAAPPVLIEGQRVEGAFSEVSIEKQVLEFRDGTTNTVQLIPGPATYRVCVESRNLIRAVEAACAPGSDDPYLDIVVEDGRSFVKCLVESSNTVNQPARCDCPARKPGTRYCFRCEGVQ